MNLDHVSQALSGSKAQTLLKELYTEAGAVTNQERYLHVAEGFCRVFGQKDFEFFTSPGRTEIGGNHTDHNHGKVLTGSINLDCVAAAAKNGQDTVHIVSETYHQDIRIRLDELEAGEETGGTLPLLKGILNGFLQKGYAVGGFDAYITSNVISAAGVSSSASFEMLICCIVNYFFNDGRLDAVTCAQIGQYSENVYWNKQSGLLDQMACAVGGVISIDFKDTSHPVVKKMDFSFNQIGCDLVIVNTGKGHADLSAEYSSIPIEMKEVAACFGREVLAEITMEELLSDLPRVRREAGDRAVLRAMHFLEENSRVDEEVKALEEGRYDAFLTMISDSGNSSWKWLQNCYCIDSYKEQSITVALALTELYLKKLSRGACRVHGGGFAGVIMAVIPKEHTADYMEYMESKLGKDTAYVMNIRKYGAIHFDL
ncbi:galactokinase [Lachnotalea sp. AF33-28]|uniref:galactokinase n=1 Tax=Lachnotalea sp. AF33-28 TaxID=2292046 RepID=UPI000E4CCFD4|nr:galactokinase family protein [Lachnotalea sp. AF33-28]RHP30529.1 galactokinase [Lachnotalea sp. AF33-28]